MMSGTQGSGGDTSRKDCVAKELLIRHDALKTKWQAQGSGCRASIRRQSPGRVCLLQPEANGAGELGGWHSAGPEEDAEGSSEPANGAGLALRDVEAVV